MKRKEASKLDASFAYQVVTVSPAPINRAEQPFIHDNG